MTSLSRFIATLTIVTVCATFPAGAAAADELLARAQAAFTEQRWDEAATRPELLPRKPMPSPLPPKGAEPK